MDWILGVSQDAVPWFVLGWYLGRSGVTSLTSQGSNSPSGKPLSPGSTVQSATGPRD